MSSPPSKRSKPNDKEDKNDIQQETCTTNGTTKATTINPLPSIASILDRFPSASSVRSSMESAQPFPHAVIPDVLPNSSTLIQEIKDHSTVAYKESDLFSVYQSMDLGNALDADKVPTVCWLRRLLLSPEFINYMEECTGLSIDPHKLDASVNGHAPGGHLLCHDDVISTRCLSFVLYLTKENWTTDNGGLLELYPAQNGEPVALPTKSIVPTRNSLALFPVVPGVSFHAVSEVLQDEPRLSLQGWYHHKKPPPQIEAVPTRQLLLQESQSGLVLQDVDGSGEFTSQDQAYLEQYIDSTYFTPDAMAEIRQVFEDESSVQLQRFFVGMDDMLEHLKEAPSIDTHGWTLQGPAHKQRYLEYTGTGDDARVWEAWLEERQQVLCSPSMVRYLHHICQITPVQVGSIVRCFQPGRDYTVAYVQDVQRRLDVTWCACVDNAIWSTGNVGGYECYVAQTEEDDGPAEVYQQDNEDDDGPLLSVHASNNTLSLVLRDEGTLRFVKYTSAAAPSPRWDVAVEYALVEEEEEEQEEQKEDDEQGETDRGQSQSE